MPTKLLTDPNRSACANAEHDQTTVSGFRGTLMHKNNDSRHDVVIIGGGPAGLTAAYELTKHGNTPVVLEKADKVGGISRTDQYKGYYFDMGGHRFFTKVQEVKDMWQEVLGGEFLRRPRLSRIYYKHKFFNYPLKPANVVTGLGPVESVLIMLSYMRWQIFPYRQEETFEEWVTNRFGRRLFLTFFKTYTEKVWGISCSELKAEWAAQRIKDLSVKTILLAMFFKPKKTIKTLIEEFDYPRLGPGMMWEAVKDRVEERGGSVEMNADVVKINRTGNRIDNIHICQNGKERIIEGTDFISSMPVTEFIRKLEPAPPADILAASSKLSYRDFVTVCLIVNQPDLFPDNWIYIHDPSVQVGRIQNFKNWSPDMVPDQSKTSLGLEYFCTEGDSLWNKPEAELIEQAKQEIEKTGLARYADVEDGCIVRVPKAYPIYDADYVDYLAKVRTFVDGLTNFQTVGRNGLHRYNNQDHAMLTGMYAARNVVLGEENCLWTVNTDKEYHEEVQAHEENAPRATNKELERALGQVFPKLDRVALGLALGITGSIGLFLATIFLVIKGGNHVGANLQLLSNYLPGYTVSWAGSLLGLVYGLLIGYACGWSYAGLRNLSLFVSAAITRQSMERQVLRQVFEYL